MSAGLLQSRISLISRKDIRWEGILVQVDRENASVTLRDGKEEGRLLFSRGGGYFRVYSLRKRGTSCGLLAVVF